MSANPKTAICKCCQEPFIKLRPLQRACSPACALWIGKEKTKKLEARETRLQLQKIKPRSDYLKEAQREFNAYIRRRDEKLACISCGINRGGIRHAGHYRSVGSCPELRFDEKNCWSQCPSCNLYLSGNLILYRAGLVERCGIAVVEYLEGPHEAKKWTIEDLKAIKAHYKQKAKELAHD